jgi:hypothetical protein
MRRLRLVVVRAPITYALDLLLSPEKRKPLVDRRIVFDGLISELLDALRMVNVACSDVVAFAFYSHTVTHMHSGHERRSLQILLASTSG